jgi:RNA polymerase sigma-70 factor, ECF subfamily
VEISPSQSVEGAPKASISPVPEAIHSILIEELWRECDVAAYGLTRGEFNEILLRAGKAQNYGLSSGATPSWEQQTTFFRNLRLSDLVLAQACANGNERAWEHLFALYRQPLINAAVAITGSDTLGRDLADTLYAELYGLTTRDGQRRCPLDSYKGRGSLLSWLRTTIARRHVDHHRRSFRELPLDDPLTGYDAPALNTEPAEMPTEPTVLGKAIKEALRRRQPEDRFLLAAYYLDERTLRQIGQDLNVGESTVSRKLKRVTDDLRKQVLRNLQGSGLSRRAAEEALGTDPRDLDINLKKLLQSSHSDASLEKDGR